MLPQRPVNVPRLAEATAANTSALNLQHHPVLGHLDVGHQRLLNITHAVHVHHQLFGDGLPRVGIVGGEGANGSVLVVGYVVKGRHVDPRDLCRQLQETLPPAPGRPVLLITVHQFEIHGLALADIEQVEEVGQRLRVVRAGASADHDGIVFTPLTGVQRNLGQLQHLQDVGVTHLVLQGDAQKVKVLHRFLGLQGKQGDILFPHDGV